MLLTLLLALQAPGTAEPVIVVEGARKSDAEIRDEASAFVKAVAAPAGAADQLARWNQPICTKVLGGTEAETTLVLDRIRAIAVEAGIRQAKTKSCAPNILVAYTHDPSDVVDTFLQKRPHAAWTLPIAARSDLIAGAYPVRWWYDLKTEGRSGEVPIGDSPALLGALTTNANGPGAGAGGQIAQSEHQSGNLADYNSSIISTKSRQSIGAATVIIDVNRVRGQSRDAVASYVAMVALAPMKLPPRPVPTPTITNLFYADTAARSDDLSEWDRAYIAALYRTAADRRSRTQAGLMTARIARNMRGGN